MAGDTVQFVDSIASSPTVRLDLNDQTIWAVTVFDAPPPQLRRNITQNALRAGAHIGYAVHDTREIQIQLELIRSTEDLNATQLQLLARELDRPSNFIKFQRTGATSPVFFKVYRSDAESIHDVFAAAAFRQITINLLAEPYAFGLQETGSATINNDPANATNGCFYTFPTVKGDLGAPLRVTLSHSTTNHNGFTILLSATATNYLAGGSYPGVYQLKLSEATTKPTITTGDAAMSNGDYARATGSTSNHTDFVFDGTETVYAKGNTTVSQMEPGTYKCMARFRGNTSANTLTCQVLQGSQALGAIDSTTFTINSGQTMWVDLGTVSVPWGAVPKADAVAFQTYTNASPFLTFKMQGSNTNAIDWDSICFVPVNPSWDTETTNLFIQVANSAYAGTIKNVVIDTDSEAVTFTDESVPKFIEGPVGPTTTGGFPSVYPNNTNILHLFNTFNGNTNDLLTYTSTLAWSYYPRYLYVRPATT